MDVEQQRNQLFRKLEALKEKGIILAPNMTVLKSDPSHQSGGAPGHSGGPGGHPAAGPSVSDVMFYHNPEVHHQGDPHQGLSPSPGSDGHGKLRQAHSAVATKRSSSMNRMDQQLAPANSVAAGGSLKKDSFASFGAPSGPPLQVNPHQFSHVNEAKLSVVAGAGGVAA